MLACWPLTRRWRWCRLRMIRYNEDVDPPSPSRWRPAWCRDRQGLARRLLRGASAGERVAEPTGGVRGRRRHGVSDVAVSAGAAPSVRCVHGDSEHDAECRFIVGAAAALLDSRRSPSHHVGRIEATLGGLLVRPVGQPCGVPRARRATRLPGVPGRGGYVASQLVSRRRSPAGTPGTCSDSVGCARWTPAAGRGRRGRAVRIRARSGAWPGPPSSVASSSATPRDGAIILGLAERHAASRSVSDVVAATTGRRKRAVPAVGAERMHQHPLCAHLAWLLRLHAKRVGKARGAGADGSDPGGFGRGFVGRPGSVAAPMFSARQGVGWTTITLGAPTASAVAFVAPFRRCGGQ